MVPFGLTEAQFCTRYRRELDRISEQTISVVRALTARPANVDVQYADIEVFLDEYGGAPSVWVYYLGENNKVDRNDQSIFAGRSLDLQLPLDRLADFDERYFLGEEFRGLFLAANVLKSWFSECWWKAGGWTYSVATRLKVHDDRGDGNVIRLTEIAR
jgi:hypothetical protein